jgi:transposase
VTGIDLGLTHFAVLSDGRKIPSPRFLRRAEKNLKRRQRALSHKQKGSRNRDKARVKVARAQRGGERREGRRAGGDSPWSAGKTRSGPGAAR